MYFLDLFRIQEMKLAPGVILGHYLTQGVWESKKEKKESGERRRREEREEKERKTPLHAIKSEGDAYVTLIHVKLSQAL